MRTARKLSLSLPLGLTYLVLIAFLSATFLFIRDRQESWNDDKEIVARTHMIFASVNQILTKINLMESQARGYLLTRRGDFMGELATAEKGLYHDLATLKQLIIAPSVREKSMELTPLVHQRVDQIHALTDAFDTRGLNAALALLLESQKTRMRIDAIVDSMMTELEGLMAHRLSNVERSRDQVKGAFVGSFVANLLLVTTSMAFLAWYLSRRNQEQAEQRAREWMATRQALVAETLSAEHSLSDLAQRVLEALAQHTGALAGSFYVREEEELALRASLATHHASLPTTLSLGQGLLGEAARSGEPVRVAELPPDYWLKISTSLGEKLPSEALVLPVAYQGRVQGVLELACASPATAQQWELVLSMRERIAVALEAAKSRCRLEALLQRTREQADTLAQQQEELIAMNEELTAQAEQLRLSEKRLEFQQRELEERNTMLERQACALEEKSHELQGLNAGLGKSQEELRRQAAALARVSQYKSEFLANMSHEIRTPLNSILVLSQLLVENAQGNLTSDQRESARTIVSSGLDLLSLINDVLDLAKVESGRSEVEPTSFSAQDLLEKLTREFRVVAERKQISLRVGSAEDAPTLLFTDRQKVEQVLKNLVGNAIKFTEKGEVRVEVGWHRGGPAESPLLASFRIADTGIGIPADKHDLVFEAFQQADGSTSRRFGGTGLGLSIARELAKLLGGTIALESTPGKGSVFTFTIPTRLATSRPDSPATGTLPAPSSSPAPTDSPQVSEPNALADDRHDLQPSDRVVLIIEDDPEFAQAFSGLAHEKGFKCLLAASGERGVRDAEEYRPEGIILDVKLPGMNGMEVLGRLKSSPATRHIPVHIVSGVDIQEPALRQGAVGFLMKPAMPDALRAVFDRVAEVSCQRLRRLLLVEDDPSQQKAMADLLSAEGVELVAVRTAAEARHELANERPIDCMVLDLLLPDMDGLSLLEQLAGDTQVQHPPVVVYTGKSLSRAEERRLSACAESIIIKGARSLERLLDETTLFLHQVESSLPAEKRTRLQAIRNREGWLKGCTILLADDDIRNVYAILRVLEEKGAAVAIAANGKEAVDYLAAGNRADAVLMDIMMPVMDGLEATQTIRSLPGMGSLPIIALTAKAMPGDRDRCFEVGCSDYLTKPVDIERLGSVLKVWLSSRVM